LDEMSDTRNQMTHDVLARMAGHGDIRYFEKGEILFEEHDAPDGVYILLEGELKVYVDGRQGREVVYATLKPIELFGEMLLDGGARSASVKALTRARCAVVPADALRALVRSEPDFAEHTILGLIARLRTLSQSTRRLATHQVRERVFALLDDAAVDEGNVRAIARPLTQQEIANRVGASREMVNHVLRDLRTAGHIMRDDGDRLLILKPLPAAC